MPDFETPDFDEIEFDLVDDPDYDPSQERAPEGWRKYADVIDVKQYQWLQKHPEHDQTDVLCRFELRDGKLYRRAVPLPSPWDEDREDEDETDESGENAAPMAPWTKAELDELGEDISEGDVRDALALRPPAMRDLLEARPDDASDT